MFPTTWSSILSCCRRRQNTIALVLQVGVKPDCKNKGGKMTTTTMIFS